MRNNNFQNKNQLVKIICLQFFIIILFSLIYYVIGKENFEFNIFNKNSKRDINYLDYLYFSIVTSSSTGYGDILPTTDLSRLLTCIQMFLVYTTILRIFFIYTH